MSNCPHGAVDSIFCTPCAEAQAARIAEVLGADSLYLRRWYSRNAGTLRLLPTADEAYVRAHPDRLPPPNRGNE